METSEDNSKNSKSTKKKFIPLSEIDNVLLPGRHKCDCEATTHELICNCLNCGRIVCEQENVGPCFTCKEMVVTKQEIEEFARKAREFSEMKQKQNNESNRQDKKSSAPMNLKEIASSLIGIEKATEHKDKLLEFERTSEKRTKVIDDEMDYFDLTRENWLSNEKREELREKVEKLHEDKFEVDRRFELDFYTRQVVEVCIPKVKDLNEEVTKLKEEAEFKSDYEIVDFKEILANEPEVEPYFVEIKEEVKKSNKRDKYQKNKSNKKTIRNNILPNINLIRNRLQDSELFEVADEGYALSINQPHASLLIHQIKLHEGRSWPTMHRGPLYIHASAKSPRKEEIQEACALFKLMLGNNQAHFPDSYPLGCIIGRVNLVDCLSQEEYQSKYGHAGYIEDPFVFIFDNVIKLKVDVPCPGRQKIYKLEKSVFKVLSSQIAKTYGSTRKKSTIEHPVASN